MRWVRCPDDRRLHLLAPAEVLCATGRGHAQALCGRSVPVKGLTLTDDSSGALCLACLAGVPAGSADLGPKGTAPRPLTGHRYSVDPPGSGSWRDAEGTPIPLHSRVEQSTVDAEHGALPSRLHQQGRVIGRGTGGLVYVRFAPDDQLIALRPHLLRVLDTPDGC